MSPPSSGVSSLDAPREIRQELFVASFVALFLEVTLIRWVPAYERVLAYFTNFVLISAFLGLGLGAILASKRRSWMPLQGLLVLGLVGISILFRLYVKTTGSVGDVFYADFFRPALVSLSLPICLAFFFFFIAIVFVPLGQRIGQCLAALPSSLEGYTINISGSIAGVLAFSLMSLLRLTPWCWFGVALVPLLWLARRSRMALTVNTLAAVVTVAMVWWAGQDYIWTPYNKLAVQPVTPSGEWEQTNVRLRDIPALAKTPGFVMTVNDDFFQNTRDLSPAGLRAYPESTNLLRHYDMPYQLRHYDDVLVVGAGTGNDVAAALRHGAQRVDAVEIDPVIARIGRLAHPEQPYSDPRVTLVIDDARSFFSKTDRKYDLIVFGMLDSHRLFSGMSSVRLDSFVYTLESFRQARSLLNDHGLVCVQHALGNEFIQHRVYWMLEDVFEAPPGVLGDNPPTFIDGPGLLDFKPPPGQLNAPRVTPATDDWPFFYLAGRHMPPEYRTALAMMLSIAVVLVLIFAKSTPMPAAGQFWHFFFLGAAFLLIETLSVTRFALLFGSTWIVNSVVFTAILLTVLAANFSAQRTERISTIILYALLAAGVVINYVAPLHLVLAMPMVVRLAVAVVLMGAPIFWAALIFARSFRDTRDVTSAFAANLLGAVVGGLTEYSALVIGFRNQLLIALAMYALSYLAIQWGSRKRGVTAPVV